MTYKIRTVTGWVEFTDRYEAAKALAASSWTLGAHIIEHNRFMNEYYPIEANADTLFKEPR